MKESNRTLVYVAVAAASVGLAFATRYATEPAPLAEFVNVGEPFYPTFENPNEAKSLEVIAYNEDTATIKDFRVEFKDGLWRIPSHHDYPADAEDRLSNTAASVIGIERGTLVGRRESDYERFGVIDPLNEDTTALKGRGQRITLAKENGEVLADYIIGKKYESPTPGTGEGEMYYVRRPKEKETYRTRLEIDLSTKFSDWIEADLLKIQSGDLREVVINKYSIDEANRQIVGSEVNRLSRDKSVDPWTLEGLDEETEEVNTDDIRKMVDALSDLKIVGVRPKPPGLTPDLRVDREFVNSQLQLDMLVNEMSQKGFPVIPGDDGKLRLASNEGELTAATENGVVYTLRFGEIFTGSEFEIEVGFASDSEDDEEAEEGEEESNAEQDEAGEESSSDGQSGESDDESSNSELKRSRYLFVSADFAPKYLGDAPQKPEEPTPPEITDAAAEESDSSEQPSEASEDSAAEESSTDAEESGDAAAEADSDKESDESAPADEADAEPEDPQAAYEEARRKYEADLKIYESDLEQYNKKLEDNRKTATDLNERFAGWYYVISAESFEDLRLSREALVKPKEIEGEGETANPASDLLESSPDTPPESSDDQPAEGEDSETAKPADDEEQEAPSDKPSTDPPTDESEDGSTEDPGETTPESRR